MHAYLFGSTTDSLDSIFPNVRVLGIVPTLDEALEAVSTYFLDSQGEPVCQILDANGDADGTEDDWDEEMDRDYFVDEYVDNVVVLRWGYDIESGGWVAIAL